MRLALIAAFLLAGGVAWAGPPPWATVGGGMTQELAPGLQVRVFGALGQISVIMVRAEFAPEVLRLLGPAVVDYHRDGEAAYLLVSGVPAD